MNIVQDCWSQNIQGVPMYKLTTKMKNLKGGLKRLNKEKFSNIENETMLALSNFTEAQRKIHLQPLNEGFHRWEHLAMQEYNRLNTATICFLRRKVKSDWLKGGDEQHISMLVLGKED